MGLLTNKDDDYNAGLALEKMMKEFDIDLDDDIDKTDEKNSERIDRRREKIKKERE